MFGGLLAYCFCFLLLHPGRCAANCRLPLLGDRTTSQDVGRYLVASSDAGLSMLVLGAFDAAFAPIMRNAWASVMSDVP